MDSENESMRRGVLYNTFIEISIPIELVRPIRMYPHKKSVKFFSYLC